MTDRHAGYIVTLEHDIREDDAEDVVRALTMVKGVLSVLPVTAGFDQAIGQERSDTMWRNALMRLARTGPAERGSGTQDGSTK